MKFAMLWRFKEDADPGKITQAITKRAEWTFPKGVKLLHEYWSPNADLPVISIMEADDATALIKNVVPWTDTFKVTTYPIEDWEVALKKFRSS